MLLGLSQAACAWAACWAPAVAARFPTPTPSPSSSTSPPSSFLQLLLPSSAPDLLAQLEGHVPIYHPGVAWALRNADRQLFYPPWLQGEWEFAARFAAAAFPQGRRFLGRTVPGVLKGSMVAALPDVGAAMEAPLRYRARYELSSGEGGVVADRVFNVRQLMDAFFGFEVTRRVEYEPSKDPTRLTVVYATPRQERSVISEDLRKAELLINNRTSEQLSPTDFICAELFRQVSQASAQGFVSDYETISRFTLLEPTPPAPPAVAQPAAAPAAADSAGAAAPGAAAPGAAVAAGGAVSSAAPSQEPGPSGGSSPSVGIGARVRVLQRVAAFLQPQDAAYFEAGNQAVATYDYTYEMTRVA